MLYDSQARRAEWVIERDGASEGHAPQKSDTVAAYRELGAQETPVPPLPKLWQGGRRGDRVSVGKSGLYLCRTAHDDAACSTLWSREADEGGRGAVADDQPGNGESSAARLSQPTPTLTRDRSGASQTGDQRRADGT